MTVDPNTIPDDVADAAITAYDMYTLGEAPTYREVKIARQAMRVAVAAALDAMNGNVAIARLTEQDRSRRALIDAVLDTHKGVIGTHYDGCHAYHAGCLAKVLRGIEDEE